MRRYLLILTALTALTVPFPTGQLLVDAPLQPRFTTTGYQRQQAFGPGWAVGPNGCDSRQTAMAAAWSTPCTVAYRDWDVGPIRDPYTGDNLLPIDVEIDHIYPLSAAWDMGAHAWPQEMRLAFANDPLNLTVTSSRANQSKSDALPGEWMPPDRLARCAYSRRISAVASKYNLPFTREDQRAMRRSCGGFQGLISRRSL
ncbi:HNH endonuclease family protein [Corynebacterium sp. Q4381]|uniref:HNH endonuclease family protein n=1 Tax=Corynebacterium sp. Marseille-Q4381 TaxID=3121597 RepID=UPI002FE65A2A